MKSQFFWAVPKGKANKEVIEYDPITNLYFRTGFENAYIEEDFDWISDTSIEVTDTQVKACANYENEYDEIPE